MLESQIWWLEPLQACAAPCMCDHMGSSVAVPFPGYTISTMRSIVRHVFKWWSFLVESRKSQAMLAEYENPSDANDLLSESEEREYMCSLWAAGVLPVDKR